MGRRGLNSTGSLEGPVTRSCGKSNEFKGYIKCYRLLFYRTAGGNSLCSLHWWTGDAIRKGNWRSLADPTIILHCYINPLKPTDLYTSRTAPLTSKRCILYIYSTNVGTEYFKHALYSPSFSLQNAVCFIMLTSLVPVLFTFYIQSVPKLKKNYSGGKGLTFPGLLTNFL